MTTHLPAGVVSFLFTDIEGSTAHWEDDPPAMEKAQTTSREVIRESVDLHHGVVFKVVGDGMYAAFESATDALAAAQEAQITLQAEEWEGTRPLQVRVAVHTGTAFPGEGDYVGQTLNRCARLLDAGHGGQILVSETTAGLTRTHLSKGAELHELGRFELPGLAEPEVIFQLASRDLPGDFRPLRAPMVRRTNLPSRASSFVGRTGALNEIRSMLREARLITLVGPGGAGKTRLAIEVGESVVDEYPDGVWLVELAPLTNSELLTAAVAHSLGVRRRPAERLTDSVLDHLRSKSLLLVLDNCEHVVDAAASFVDSALRSSASLTMLATSREALGVDGEHRWSIEGLEVPPDEAHADQMLESESVRLFADRGGSARAGFSVDAHNAGTVRSICRELDGLPLAIELAAARLKTLSLDDLAHRLEDRFGLLTGGPRTSLPRHQSLRAVVGWSFDLLDQDERALFAALSVFAGGFTLDGAEAVAEPNVDTLQLLDRLIDKSLVVADIDDSDEARYRLLETLRQYGQEVLSDWRIADTVAARHADFYVRLAEEARRKLRGPDHAWYERVDREHDNIRKALTWALGTGGQPELAARMAIGVREFWQVRGHWRESRRWLDLCLRQAVRLPPIMRGRLEHAAGVTSALLRDYGRAFPQLEAALEVLRESGEPADVADALFDLAQAAARHGDYRRAEALLAECRTLYEDAGNQTGVAEAACVRAQVSVFRGDAAAAERHGKDAREGFEQLGDQYGEAWVLSVLAEAAYAFGDLDDSENLFQAAAALAEEIGVPQFVANGLQGIGDVQAAGGNYTKAEGLLAESLRINRRIGDQLFVAGVLASLAEVAARRGEPARAARLWGLDRRIREDLGSMPPRRRGGRYDQNAEALRTAARRSLGDEALDRLLEEGAALTLDDLAGVSRPGSPQL